MSKQKPKLIQELEELLDVPSSTQYFIFLQNPESGLYYVYDNHNVIKLRFTGIESIPIKFYDLLCGQSHLRTLIFGNCLGLQLDQLKIESLEHLNLISNDSSGFKQINLPALERIELIDENLEDISFLQNLTKISSANFSFNQITTIPRLIAERFSWLNNSLDSQAFDETDLLSLAENPLEFPPPSVIQEGPKTVQNYYEVAESHGDSPLSEGRIIVVGDGSAGKSSLIEKVLYNTFEEGKPQTNGVKVEDWPLEYKNRTLQFHLWDFGGQEIQHAVHKFFFTEGCLYVLVLDNRKEEEPEYWLEQISTLGGSASVMVVFNKADENRTEVADRKYLKEKYPNIVGFFQTSCKTELGIADFKNALEEQAVELRTVHERLPNNWLVIKKELEVLTSGEQHYLTYEVYQEICRQNHVVQEEVQKLLLKYFNTLGVVTWFGETYLNFMHVLSPAWITQGVYKLITANRTARLFGQISVSDFPELLHPAEPGDFTYEKRHYGYLLSMMRKFDLCYSPDDQQVLIPSGFGKEPKVEYQDFKGEGIRTYILQFQEYLPMYLIHRFIAQKLPHVFESNYWYSGIVAQDPQTDSLYMVQADKKARRIYVRIKGAAPLGVWEHVRREIRDLSTQYAHIPYHEKVVLEEDESNVVDYKDLIAHLQSEKMTYFHPGLRRDFNVGYLMGIFETKESTLQKIEKHDIQMPDRSISTPVSREDEEVEGHKLTIPPFVIQILNNNTSEVSPQIQNQVSVNVDIDIELVQNAASATQGEVHALLEELKGENEDLKDALEKVMQFTEAAKKAKSKNEVTSGGWKRKLKNVVNTLKTAKEQVKKIEDGKEMIEEILSGLKKLAGEFDFTNIAELIAK